MFGVFVFLGLAVNIKSGAGENTSDASLTIAFFLVFFRRYNNYNRIKIVRKLANIYILY
jgi:hypothetical protein